MGITEVVRRAVRVDVPKPARLLGVAGWSSHLKTNAQRTPAFLSGLRRRLTMADSARHSR